jgi:hypothetical protein
MDAEGNKLDPDHPDYVPPPSPMGAQPYYDYERAEILARLKEQGFNYWQRVDNQRAMGPNEVRRFLDGVVVFGTMTRGAQAAGVSCQTVRNLMRDSPEFKILFEEAKDQFKSRVEELVFARGVQGWLEPVIQKGRLVVDAQGRPVMVQKYDARAFEMFVKRHMDEYKDKTTTDINLRGGGLLVVPGRSDATVMLSQDEFESRYGGEQVLEGDYEADS